MFACANVPGRLPPDGIYSNLTFETATKMCRNIQTLVKLGQIAYKEDLPEDLRTLQCLRLIAF